MTHGTEEKIMDAALKEFAEKGYAGAKTKSIAERADISEMTLFRRFKTKKNLFNRVLTDNHEKLVNDFNSKKMPPNSNDFLKSLLEFLLSLTNDNFEFLSIIIYERENLSEDILDHLMNYLTEIIDEMFPQINLDSKVFVFNILSFMYMIILDKRHGRAFVNHEEAVQKFIDHSISCLQL